MISPELFIMQADRICREVFELFSDTIFSKIEIKQFDNESEGGEINNLLVILKRETLFSELEASGEKFSISEVFFSEEKLNFFVIYYNKDEKKLFDKYQTFFNKIISFLFDYFIKEYTADNSYFYNGSINSIIIRDSIDSLVTDISRKCCVDNDFSIYDNINLSLKNILSELSSLTYEKNLTEGIIYFTTSPDNANFQFKFNNYEDYGKFDLKNLKLIRKLLELTNYKNGVGIISDTNYIYGIGEIKKDCDYFTVIFNDDRKWTLYEKENELISIRNNSFVFINNLLSKREFTSYVTKIFPEKKDSDDISTMYNLLKTLIKQKKGTILVIKKDANVFLKKYQDLCISIIPTKLDEKNIEKLSSIDGAIIMDENCICYGFGAVLDGLDTGNGNRARGARYNSSERFYNLYKNEDNTNLMIFILSDDGNYNFFPER